MIEESIEDDESIKQEIEQANQVFRKKWPNHCNKCHGWGGWEISGNRWTPSEFIECESMPVTGCHRCGNETSVPVDQGDYPNGPCTVCGWNFDDGLNLDY